MKIGVCSLMQKEKSTPNTMRKKSKNMHVVVNLPTAIDSCFRILV